MIRKPVYTDLRNEEDVESNINMADYYFFRNAFNDEEIEKISGIDFKLVSAPIVGVAGQKAAKEYGVRKQDLMTYFDKETLTILRR